ncbi:hypothetical protein [Rhodanobacter denitrificans]|uniref:hypothetical protein n=1 Tax=Rhodanobacter denitrificans TaxID=666685 RepID=UPI001F2D8A5C|nr:hypothetical protein [Rhodanobacter denitrificans]UJJ60632.1 hypothetical protein LRK55_19550 [Rhodanobacter denitrificans]
MAGNIRYVTIVVQIPGDPVAARAAVNGLWDRGEVVGLYAGDAITEIELLEQHVSRTRLQEIREEAKLAPASKDVKPLHPDDFAVNAFAAAMRSRLAQKRAEGRGGWDETSPGMQQRVSDLLRAAVAKGNPVDAGNYAMFLHQRGERILPPCGDPHGEG